MLYFERKNTPIYVENDDPQMPIAPATGTVLVVSDDKGLLSRMKVLIRSGSKIVQESITDQEGRLLLEDPTLSDHEIEITLG